MASVISSGPRIRGNAPAENAYNALEASNRNIATRQLRLSTGKRINSASDDVAGYITARSLGSRSAALKSALNAVGDASSVANIAQDGLDNINSLLTQIKDSASAASSGALGTDEKVALAQSAYRLAQQIQTVVDSTVFGGKQLLAGAFSSDFVIGANATNTLLTVGIDLSTATNSTFAFDVRATSAANFGGVTGLNLASLNSVSESDLGIFSSTNIISTLGSLTTALENVNSTASYLGGLSGRLTSQEDVIKSQLTNYNAAISRIEDADVAKEQLELSRAQFLQQASLTSLSQANQSPQAFLQLFR